MRISSFLWRLAMAVAMVGIVHSVPFVHSVRATEYFVDAQSGDDAAVGTAPETAWRTLNRVNDADFQPGDVVRFKRVPRLNGETMYRGTFKPKSGTESQAILYTWYGDEHLPKPTFCNSVALNRESDWLPVADKPNLWMTAPTEFQPARGEDGQGFKGFIYEATVQPWAFHTEGGAEASVQPEEDANELDHPIPGLNMNNAYRLSITNSGTAPNHIQWYSKPFSIEKGKAYRVDFHVVSDGQPLATDKPLQVSLMQSGSPWESYSNEGSTPVSLQGVDSGTSFHVVFTANRTADDARLNFSFGALSSKPATMFISPIYVYSGTIRTTGITTDVGNLILHTQRIDESEAASQAPVAGFKRWELESLTQPGDYWCDLENKQVYLYSEQNPAKMYASIEAAQHGHVISINSVSYATFDGLDVRYGAAHGFGGSGSHHLVIRNCDISWIGGADQYLQGGGGRRVRFGNGIEFWSDAHDNLVENNRIWEIYDAALTNQGAGVNQEINITYRGNEIWNSEYSFEYWNRGPESQTRGIVFEKNVCRNAGFGWGHVQRPDKNGRHLMFYDNSAQVSDFRVTDNVFAGATESLLRMDTAFPITLDRNRWKCTGGELFGFWHKSNKYEPSDFGRFQQETGFEANGQME